jgi:hypothetical protein
MSSILKALRKIEEEKRVTNHAAPDLRMDQGNSGKKARPYLPLVAGIALGAVCVSLFGLWFSSDTPDIAIQSQQQPRVPVVESKQAVPPAVVAKEKMLGPSSEKPQTVSVQEPIIEPVAETVKVREVIMPVEAMPVEAMPVISMQAEPKKQQPKKIVPEKKAPLPEVVVSESVTTNIAKTSIPEALVVKPKVLPEGVLLKVSETFYHDDPANSMAVVNDLPVMIGSFVDSAVVLEIHSDKVVFEIDENTYDVPVTPLP